MTRSQELVASLKASPRDEGHLEALVRWFSRKGEWDGLYAALTELVGDTEDLETLEWYRAHLAQVLQRHIDTVEDPALGGALRLRLANLLAEHLGRREEAVVLIAEAFERHPSAQVLDRALAHLEQLGELRFAARLLRTRATAETDPDRAADLWLRLGYTLRSLGELARSLEAFHAAAGDTAPGRTAAREAEQLEALVTRAREALEEARAEDGPDPEARIRVGRMLLSLHPGDREGSDRLLEAFLAEPGREDLIPHLLDALSDAGRWEDLQEVLRARVEVATDPAERRELLVERFRIRLLRQGDREGTAALQEQIHRAAPGDRAVVATLAGFWAELGEWEAVSELYGQARRLAGSREEENAFLEAEAVLAWQRMGDHERAEKLFRRIRSVDPKNTTCLRFYEDYYESQEDWRKLFTTLSTRQGLVPDAEKPALLLRMAVLADERIAAPDRAIDALKKVLMLDPGIAAASERLQAIYRREGKWHALVDFLDGQVARLGEERTAEKVGLLWEVHGIYSAADRQPIPEMELATLKRIVQVDPGETRALGLLAEVYRESQRWSALAEVLQGLADHDPEPAARRTRLGELARLYAGPLRSPRKATATLEAILADDPGDGEAQEALTEIYRSGGMTEGLYSVLQSRLKGARGAARRELLDELARIALDRLKRPEEGLEYLEKLVAIDPGDEASRSRLQQLYTQLGRWETLAEHLERRLKATKQKEGRAEILESLGELYLDRLGDAARARAIYETLLELNPRARGARESLRRLLVLERDWEALRGFFQDGEDWSGYLQLLEEAWRRADEPALVRDIGWELIRGAEDLLRDPERGLGYLSRMLERLPEDVSVARGLLERSDRCPAAVRVSALAVLADAGAGAEAEDAASALADLLESTGEPAGAHVRTLALLVQRLARGDAGLLERAVERAEAADALAELVAAVEGLLPDLPDRRVAEAVTVRLAAVYRERLRDLAGATRLLEAAQAEDGAAFPILEALERTRLAAGDLEALEAVLARLVEVAPSQEQRREKLLTLARLHEDVLAAPDRAYADYRLLVEHVPGDPEGYQGMIRTLEQQGDTAGLVEVLEELLSLVRDPEERRGLMLRIARLSWAELGAGPAAAEWCRRIVEGTPDDPDAVRLARDIFDAGEAPELLIPILRDTYERSHAWSDLVEVLHAEAGLAAEPAERGALLLRAAELLETKLQRLDEAYETLVRCVILEAGDEALRQRAEDLAERTDRLPAFAELLAGLAGVGDHPTPLEMPLEDDAALRVCDRLAALAGDRLGDDGLAARALRRGLELDPDRRDLVDRLAAVLRRTEQWSPLLELLRDGERLLFTEEERKACHLEIAAILAERLGDDAGAIPWLES
ncbi:MAG: hypothetical protein FJ098_04980, partial [Deltaproteobacteria bacterium]|nr:hypothetical protein [Deltaproteobacteria bacterium]